MEAPRAQRRLLCPRAHRRGCLNGAGGLGRGALWELTQALSIWLQNHSLSTTGPMHAGRSGAGLRNGQSWGLEPMLGKTQKSREPAFFPREHRHIFIPLEHKPQHPGAQPEGHHPQAAVPRQQPLSWDVEDGLWPSAQRTPALADTQLLRGRPSMVRDPGWPSGHARWPVGARPRARCLMSGGLS